MERRDVLKAPLTLFGAPLFSRDFLEDFGYQVEKDNRQVSVIYDRNEQYPVLVVDWPGHQKSMLKGRLTRGVDQHCLLYSSHEMTKRIENAYSKLTLSVKHEGIVEPRKIGFKKHNGWYIAKDGGLNSALRIDEEGFTFIVHDKNQWRHEDFANVVTYNRHYRDSRADNVKEYAGIFRKLH